jgi:serine protease Do
MNTNEYQNYYEQQQESNQGSEQGPEMKTPKKEKNFGKKMTRCVAYALAFGLIAGTAFQGSSYALQQIFPKKYTTASTASSTKLAATAVSTTNSNTSASTTDITGVVSDVMPSIVAITNMENVQYQTFFGQTQNYESKSAGSGIIVKEDDTYYYIATNNHVVEGTKSLTVQFADLTTASAEVQGTNATNDLAVVKVKKSDIKADTLSKIKVATLGDSAKLSVGEPAIAIGNALGYGQSVTTGVISALNREVSIQDETNGATVSNKLIQTDAAINPGNSGGALIDSKGEVIGINSSKYSDTSVEGMGFSIPMSTAKPVIEDLITNGTATATSKGAYLGIAGVDVTDEVSSSYNIPAGVYVTQVMSKSAAETAGFSQGDIITKIDDQKLTAIADLKKIISGHKTGDKVTITYQRRDNSGSYKESTMKVTLGENTGDDSSNSSNSGQQGNDNSQNPFGQQGNNNSQNPFGQQGNGNSQNPSDKQGNQSGNKTE